MSALTVPAGNRVLMTGSLVQRAFDSTGLEQSGLKGCGAMEFEPGKLYRAISAEEVIELDPPKFKGLKLLIFSSKLKGLKKLQKGVEKRLGHRPDLALVVNAVLSEFLRRYQHVMDAQEQEELLGMLYDNIVFEEALTVLLDPQTKR
jgi:hypothetical protein